ncbi:NmrA family NAD(P)-binding protein [Micromonospora zamorensis]|uniref:NmrA family NAD(P)-binding protein n=1 Tax=Micromonospora zamorensis TaxID=709883 RepID=UPI003D92EE4B
MTKVLVIGATGNQGGAVTDLLLDHGHEVVAYVRAPESLTAQALAARGVQLATGNLADAQALRRAASGVDAVFGLSVPFGEGGKEEEIAQGRLIVDTAARAGAHLVYSSVRGADQLVGKRIDLASDSVTGEEAAQILSGAIGREIPYRQMPIAQVRQWAGDEIADMFQRFEENTDFVDVAALRAQYPGVAWHSYADWARTVDWDRVLKG